MFTAASSPRISPVTQTVKNPPAMQGTRLQSLAWEVPLGKGTAAHLGILVWGIPWTEAPGATVHGVTESDAAEPLTSLLFRCPDGETSQSGPLPRGLGVQAGTWRVATPARSPGTAGSRPTSSRLGHVQPGDDSGRTPSVLRSRWKREFTDTASLDPRIGVRVSAAAPGTRGPRAPIGAAP